MKRARYGPRGGERPGLLDADGRVRDLGGQVADVAGVALLPETLARLATLDPADLPLVPGAPQAGLRLGPCVGAVCRFIAVGLNHADHAAESGLQMSPEPVIFDKWTSCINGPDDDVILPRGSAKTDWEAEPGDVIATGTPPGAGTGRKPPVYLKGGEVMRLSVEGLGVQRQRVVAG